MANPILRWFDSSHLPGHLRVVVKDFEELATKIDDAFIASPEASVALRKLLEAKDAAVRAALHHAEKLKEA